MAAALIAVAGAVTVIAPLLRLKRRIAALGSAQMFVSLNNLQPEMLHLQRSLTMLVSQVTAIKTALDRVRNAIALLRSPLGGASAAQVKAQFGSLLALLR